MHAIGFDLDGTLLQTLPDIGGACNVVLARHGYPQHPIPAYAQMVGNGFEMLVRRALPQDRLPDASAFADLVAEAKAYYAAHMQEETRPYAGAAQALHELAARGISLFVLSNKPEQMTCALVRHYFPGVKLAAVAGATPDAPLKPDPEALLAVIGATGAAPQDCAYVGDSDVDMRVALSAGVIAVGAAWGFRGTDELLAAGCRILLDTPAQIPGLPERMGWTIPA